MQKIKDEIKLSERVSFRVCPIDYTTIQKQAENRKLNISDFMRTVVETKIKKSEK
jgi:uncharacterized protein (DUF1778 family)